MKKTFKILANCFFCIIIVFLLFMLIYSFSSDSYMKFGNYSLFAVNGDSMKPKLDDGDLISIRVNNSDSYKVGDIITYEYDEILITHEIKEVIYDSENEIVSYITKGINNNEKDDYFIKTEEIIGEYKGFKIPLLGYVVNFATTRVGYLLLVVIPLGLILFWVSYELVKEISSKKEER